ncbi:hypothetical protein Tsubulata_013204 [Turnera subulata]|uniref:FRIGIDA-like protein n=1 Tax=Turnera subulata TaxID=218843 RepID=A0A9Q0FKP8_9ROSI|nr:hypothetical protein Tsubulata_013204 [Turnera subulata]
MDASGLLKFVVSKQKESVLLQSEIPLAVMEEAVDPTALLLEVMEELVRDKAGRTGITDKRWACATLVQGLFPDEGKNGEKKGPGFSRRAVEKAATEREDRGLLGCTVACVLFLDSGSGVQRRRCCAVREERRQWLAGRGSDGGGGGGGGGGEEEQEKNKKKMGKMVGEVRKGGEEFGICFTQ